MPRPNPQRTVYAEDHLAERIAHEREARGWSLERLAKEMTQAGCPLSGTAVYKTESGTPRRRIVVDELLAYSQVFGIPIENLVLPPAIAAQHELAKLAKEWAAATGEVALRSRATLDAFDRAQEVVVRIRAHIADHPDLTDDAVGVLRNWADPDLPVGPWFLEESIATVTGAKKKRGK